MQAFVRMLSLVRVEVFQLTSLFESNEQSPQHVTVKTGSPRRRDDGHKYVLSVANNTQRS